MARVKALPPACGKQSMIALFFLISWLMRLNSRDSKGLKKMAAKCSVEEESTKTQHFILLFQEGKKKYEGSIHFLYLEIRTKEGIKEHGSKDHYRSEGEKGERTRFFKITQGIEIGSGPVKRLYLGGDTSGIR
jgi:hypothetical protein